MVRRPRQSLVVVGLDAVVGGLTRVAAGAPSAQPPVSSQAQMVWGLRAGGDDDGSLHPTHLDRLAPQKKPAFHTLTPGSSARLYSHGRRGAKRLGGRSASGRMNRNSLT
jgi:hypothetical protein